MIPFLNPRINAEKLYKESHIKTRNMVERTFGVRKRRFPCLLQKPKLKLNHPLALIVATAVLYNIGLQQNFTIDSATEENVTESNEPTVSLQGNYFRRPLLKQHLIPLTYNNFYYYECKLNNIEKVCNFYI